MKVSELIKFLQQQPQEMLVLYRRYSEQCLLKASDICTEDLCPPRNDGWIENKRPDKGSQMYLVFPGN